MSILGILLGATNKPANALPNDRELCEAVEVLSWDIVEAARKNLLVLLNDSSDNRNTQQPMVIHPRGKSTRGGKIEYQLLEPELLPGYHCSIRTGNKYVSSWSRSASLHCEAQNGVSIHDARSCMDETKYSLDHSFAAKWTYKRTASSKQFHTNFTLYSLKPEKQEWPGKGEISMFRY